MTRELIFPSSQRTDNGTESRSSIQSVERAAQLLDCLALNGHAMGVAEIGRQVGLTKATAHRLLNTLKRCGLVGFDEDTRKYGLGFHLLELSSALGRQSDLVQVAHPYMVWLRDCTGETICLHLLDGWKRFCVHQVEGLHELRMIINLGQHLPMNAGSVGKLFMAAMPEKEVEGLMERLEWKVRALHTITDPEAWLAELRAVRNQGYAIGVGERATGAASIAVLVRGPGQPIAALSIYGPEARLSNQQLMEILPLLRDAADKIVDDLRGGSSPGGSR